MAKIGLVLSGGGARGMAHIGVLKIIKESKIKIDAIAGCSAGAVAGACYAYDQNPQALERIVLKIKNINDIMDFSFSRTGLMKGGKVEKYILEYMENVEQQAVAHDEKQDKKEGIVKTLTLNTYIKEYLKKGSNNNTKKEYKFEDLKIPLFVNATDVVDGKEVVFSSGPLLPAVLASMAYPGVFAPQKIDGRMYIDGGVISPVPVNALEGMDYIIIVDVSRSKVKIDENSSFKDILNKSVAIMQQVLVKDSLERCKTKYIIIKPKVSYRKEFSFRNVAELIAEGEKAAKEAIEQIKKDIEEIEAIELKNKA